MGGGGGDGGPVSLPALGRADSRLCSDLSPSLSLKGHVGGVPSLHIYCRQCRGRTIPNLDESFHVYLIELEEPK